ncbi:HigA family addiction module antitoxin [Bifidobacterium sp. ESL0763]|uniref:HigA family addiction module antitoxin n=1 Tax=Bifidobacterium sp. ESL0763 TaxID=2983227 RepID=UPI0023F65B13|nr:HigA family addiction module antitoxin [Bifidobacterium sp. ESL0763]MDF7664487.1 HigA family addiction module antitoxin [Bifidobacterium sp. ESL0763]
MSISMTTTASTFVSTPGEILREEFLEPLKISAYKLAHAMHVSETAVGEILHGKRSITVPMAHRLGFALGTTADFWLTLQMDYDERTFDDSGIRQEVKRLVA